MTEHDIDIFARTIYGEARGEYGAQGPAALIAVANVIMNRVKRAGRYGKTLTEVCLKPRQFSCWNENDPNRLLIQQENLETDMVLSAAFGLIACLVTITLYRTSLPGEAVGIISTIAGIFGSCLKDAYAFEFGSSRGSKLKDSKLSALFFSKN